jgi:hypothetical protein
MIVIPQTIKCDTDIEITELLNNYGSVAETPISCYGIFQSPSTLMMGQYLKTGHDPLFHILSKSPLTMTILTQLRKHN